MLFSPFLAEAKSHDPAACSATLAQLSAQLELREEQIEIINLDRAKLYDEIEKWKDAMEKVS